jgi:hypothetical protein
MSASSYIFFTTCLLFAGCFHPDASQVQYKCDDENACPGALVCERNLCLQPAIMDSGIIDQSTIPEVDMAKVSGCADRGGFSVGSAFACPGVFSLGQGVNRCALGWTACTSGQMVDLAACNKLDGFFIGRAPGAYAVPNRSMPFCGTGALGTPLWFGCGDAKASKPYVEVHTVDFICSDFIKSLDCFNASWNCPGSYDLAKTVNNVAADGVLCCKQ